MAQSPLKVSNIGGVTKIEFMERSIIDEVVIAQIGQELSQLVESLAKPKIVLCFAGVQHLSSAALGILITLNSKVETREGQMFLSDVAKPIFEIFKITKLNKLFQMHDTLDQAMESFAP